MKPPTISVIIPVRNEADRLMATISTIAEGRLTDIDLEIVVVDDASTDGCCNNIAYGAPKLTIKVLQLSERVGVPRARNHGANTAAGEILLMTDAHVYFSTGWDRLILGHIKEDRVIAATIADTASSFRGYGCNLIVPFMGTKWNRNSPEEVDSVQIASSAGTALNRELFKKIGGYDAGMILYGAAEPEFSVRAWLSGAEIVSIPQLEVYHRFKQQAEVNQFLEGLRPFMIHNSVRFGLLYLSELASLQMLRHYAMLFPDQVQEAFRMVEESDIWQRKDSLEGKLIHNFDWFIEKFDLKDQVGQKIL